MSANPPQTKAATMTYQHIGNGPPPPPAQQPPPQRRSSGNGKLWLGIAIGFVVGIGIGCLGWIGQAANDKTPKTNTAAQTSPAQVAQKEQPPPATTAPPVPAGPAATIGDGTWTVGVDIAAGTWRPTVAAGSTCYWAVKKGGSNGDIISNNLGGGRPTVTLKDGQEFETTRCGTWAKQ